MMPAGLLEFVRKLEKLDKKGRRREIIARLREAGIEPAVQRCRWLGVKNIVADLAPGDMPARILFTAHYDTRGNSPGANDDASGVAVLMRLCREIAGQGKPVRIVFFDREEAWFHTPVLRLGLLGSICYVMKSNLKSVELVYNLEFCGLGDTLAVWPVRSNLQQCNSVEFVERAARRLSLKFSEGYVPWYIVSSDHLPFRRRGIDAVTLSMLPENTIIGLKSAFSVKSPTRFMRPRSTWPSPLSVIHTQNDDSSRLDESTLQKTLALTKELINISSDK
jgi:Zn-dependent M28 family amino/carboxypeptidase